MILKASKIKKTVLKKVEEVVGPDAYSSKDLDRFNYSRDSNFKSTIQIKYNKVECLPDLIVWPDSVDKVQKLVKIAIRHRIPVVPFGAGSGVCGGTVPVKGGMVIDLKRMHHLLKVDTSNLLAEVETGMMGMHLENELERKGFTLGHFPASILCASVGGYLAARSAGQKSSRYGKIEDMVCNLEVVTGKGEIVQTNNVANRDGIDLNHIFLGSEGTLGLITKATLRIFPQPEERIFRGIRFKDIKTGMEAIRRIMQSGIKPAVIRLYDELDSLLFFTSTKSSSGFKLPSIFYDFQKTVKFQSLKSALILPRGANVLTKLISTGCVLILMNEGNPRLIAEEQKVVMEISRALGGKDLGEEPGRHWYEHRYSISYNASPLFDSDIFTDTIEMSATWDKLLILYEKMTEALSPHAMIMAHLSHVYTDGGAFYFTFLAPLKGLNKSEQLFDCIWDTALETCQKVGGAISHHHGVGRLKAKYMADEWGDGISLFKTFKDLYDPHRIMNPGKLMNVPSK